MSQLQTIICETWEELSVETEDYTIMETGDYIKVET